jgi:hypothetical protein
VLAGAQRRDSALVAGHAGEVVAADPLDRNDRAGAQRGSDRVERIPGNLPAHGTEQPQ